MPKEPSAIELQEFHDGELCYGYRWSIANEKRLARLVARLALGHYRHIARILANVEGIEPPASSKELTEAAISKIQNLPEAHGNGWLFQMISWVALHCSSGEGIATAPPHSRAADKGFDSLFVTISNTTGTLSSVVICEDKATGNERNKIRDQIWPDFKKCEKGDRDSELMSETTAILERYRPDDVDALMRPFLWTNHREAIRSNYFHNGVSAVISLPTGSGKASLAELKIATSVLLDRQPDRREGVLSIPLRMSGNWQSTSEPKGSREKRRSLTRR